jgi:hypothetical protein
MRMNLKRLSVRSVLLAVLLAMAACGGAGGNSNNAGGGGNPADSATFATVVSGIANSQSLLLAEPGLTSDTQVADSRTTLDKWMELLGIRSAIAQTAPLKLLYAQDGNNTLRVINMLETINASGQRSSLSIATQIQQSSSLLPRITGIMDTPAYVLMSYSLLFKPDPQTGQINRNNLSTECPMVALSKADGAVYCITIKPYCWSDPSACQPNYGGSAIQTNAAGTIIYIKDERQGLIRLDMRNPNSATQTKLFDGGTEGWVESMVINAAGDAFVKFSSVNNHSSTEFRVYSLGQNSGFTPISTAGENPGCLLNGITSLGNADDFYYIDALHGQLNRLNKQSTFSKTPVYIPGGPSNILNFVACYTAIKATDRILVDNLPSAGNAMTELINNSTPRSIAYPNFASIVKIYPYSTGFVIWGKDANTKDLIERVSFSNNPNNQSSNVLSNSLYTLTSVAASAGGSVTFSGRNTSNNARVIGTISAQGGAPIITPNNSSSDVTAIVRLN